MIPILSTDASPHLWWASVWLFSRAIVGSGKAFKSKFYCANCCMTSSVCVLVFHVMLCRLLECAARRWVCGGPPQLGVAGLHLLPCPMHQELRRLLLWNRRTQPRSAVHALRRTTTELILHVTHTQPPLHSLPLYVFPHSMVVVKHCVWNKVMVKMTLQPMPKVATSHQVVVVHLSVLFHKLSGRVRRHIIKQPWPHTTSPGLPIPSVCYLCLDILQSPFLLLLGCVEKVCLFNQHVCLY